MARLEELQFTASGGSKTVAGTTLSPRSTRGYIRTSTICKQQSIIMFRTDNKSTTTKTANRSSTNMIQPLMADGEWRRMSLPAMLVGETVGEILRASQFAKNIADAVSEVVTEAPPCTAASLPPPRTPITARKTGTFRSQSQIRESSLLRQRRTKEKQGIPSRKMIDMDDRRSNSSSSSSNCSTSSRRSPTAINRSPSFRRRARCRINFGTSAATANQMDQHSVHFHSRRNSQSNKTSKDVVLFPNPLFHSTSPNSHQKPKINGKTSRSLALATATGGGGNIGIASTRRVIHVPHKFIIKSPPALRSKSPPIVVRSPKSATAMRSSSSATRSRSSLHFQMKSSPPPPAKTGGNSHETPLRTRFRRSLSPSKFAKRLASPFAKKKCSSPQPPPLLASRTSAACVTPARAMVSVKIKKLHPYQNQTSSPSRFVIPQKKKTTIEEGSTSGGGSKLRRSSLSPSNVAKRLISPLKSMAACGLNSTARTSKKVNPTMNLVPAIAATGRSSCCLKQRPLISRFPGKEVLVDR